MRMRITIKISDNLKKELKELKEQKEFKKKTYDQIIRRILRKQKWRGD